MRPKKRNAFLIGLGILIVALLILAAFLPTRGKPDIGIKALRDANISDKHIP
jgi:hypothetical protein